MPRKKKTQTFNWNDLFTTLAMQPAGTVAQVPTRVVAHPRDAGLRDAIPFPPVGQTAEFVLPTVEPPLRVRQYGQMYDARLTTTPDFFLERSLQDAPGSTVLGAALFGGLVGSILSGSKDGAVAGAAIGGIAGLAAVAVANARTSPETSVMAAHLAATTVSQAPKPRR